jgi:hypothetical protein
VAETYSVRVPVDYEVINQPQQERLYRTGFISAHTTSQPTMDFNRTLLNTQNQKHRGKYDGLHFRRGKNKGSESLMQREPKVTEALESLRNSTGKGKESRERLEADGEGTSCGLRERRESGSQGRKYNLFVTKKIDKYLPYE